MSTYNFVEVEYFGDIKYFETMKAAIKKHKANVIIKIKFFLIIFNSLERLISILLLLIFKINFIILNILNYFS